MTSNKATEAWSAAVESLAGQGDLAGAESRFHPAVVRVDRRAIGAETTYTRADLVTAATALFRGVGFDGWAADTVELRGDLHAVTRVLWKTKDGYEIEWLQVIEVEPDGRVVRLVYFDTDRRSAAIEELDARFRGEGPPD